MSAVLIWLAIVLAWTDHPWLALASVSLAYLLVLSDLRGLRRRVARPERAAGPQNRKRLPSAASTRAGSLGPAWSYVSARRRSH